MSREEEAVEKLRNIYDDLKKWFDEYEPKSHPPTPVDPFLYTEVVSAMQIEQVQYGIDGFPRTQKQIEDSINQAIADVWRKHQREASE